MHGSASVVNFAVKFATMLSGGSLVSWSVTFVASMTSVHCSPYTKSVDGLSVKLVGPPLTAAAWAPLIPHIKENHGATALTGSLKFTVMFWLRSTLVALSAGTVLDTPGAASGPIV